MNAASIAVAYATFGGLLVGFAFTGLCLYLQGEERKSRVEFLVPRGWTPVILAPVKVSSVAATAFYAMTSLGMSTFLYSNLAGDDDPTVQGRDVAAMLPYGALLALSVLSLFYFVTLMMLRLPSTVEAAKPAFWAATIAGSVVVLSFLAGSARDALCAKTIIAQAEIGTSTSKKTVPLCHPVWVFSFPSIAVILLAAAILFWVIVQTRVLESRGIAVVLAWCANRPTAPPQGVFIVTFIMTAWVSVFMNTRPGGYVAGPPYTPHNWLVYAGFGAGVLFVALFALGSGCVVYPRVQRNHLLADARTESFLSSPRVMPPGIEFSHGTKPIGTRRHLVWRIPGEAANQTVTTTFTVIQSSAAAWQLDGLLCLSAETVNAAAPQKVRMTWEICSAGNQRRFEKEICIGRKSVPISEIIEGGDSSIKVTMHRLDQNRDTVIICWLRPSIRPVRTARHGRSPATRR